MRPTPFLLMAIILTLPGCGSDDGGEGVVVPGTWVAVAAGEFKMGSPTTDACRGATEPVLLPVKLTHALELQSTEVTNDQFKALLGYSPSFATSCGGDCPAEMVTWHEAAAYCNALSAKVSQPPCYTCTGSGKDVNCREATGYTRQAIYGCPGYRLPTEAEWEYAYRAGSATAYHNGDNDQKLCQSCTTEDTNASAIGWYCANSSSKLHAVQKKTANAWGLYDMAGNVAEWCHDWYQQSLGSAALTDPVGGNPQSGQRVSRGGSWRFNPALLRAGSRASVSPTNRKNSLGFRCARLKPPK